MDKRIEIIRGNALEELKKLETESIDLIIADPPYNLSKDYISTKDNLEFEQYLTFSKKVAQRSFKIIKT